MTRSNLIQVCTNCVLAIVPAVLFFSLGQTGIPIPVLLASPLLWMLSLIVALISFRPRKNALWLLFLTPIALGPDLFMFWLGYGISKYGV
jgi:hypothetical protein